MNCGFYENMQSFSVIWGCLFFARLMPAEQKNRAAIVQTAAL